MDEKFTRAAWLWACTAHVVAGILVLALEIVVFWFLTGHVVP